MDYGIFTFSPGKRKAAKTPTTPFEMLALSTPELSMANGKFCN